MKAFVRILTIMIVIGALVGGVVLVRRNQETRRGAYFAQAEMFLQGAIPSNLQVNSTFPVQVYFDSKGNPVNAMAFTIETGDEAIAEVVGVTPAQGLFTNVISAGAVEGAAKVSGLINKEPDRLPSGVFHVGTIMVKANGVGSATFKLGNYVISSSKIVEGDNKLEVSFRGESYPIGSGGGSTVWLKFDPSVGYVQLDEVKEVKVILDSKDKKIAGVELNLLFDPEMTEMISFTGAAGYTSDQSKIDNTNGKVMISMTTVNVSSMKSGNVELGVLKFKPKREGGDQFVKTTNNNQVVDNLGKPMDIVGGNTDFTYENTVSYSCSDSDSGVDYETRGTVDAVTNNGSSAVHDTGEDSCSSNSVLMEYYCDNDDRKASEEHACGSGKVCSNGACISVGDDDEDEDEDDDPGVGDTDPPGVGDTDPPEDPPEADECVDSDNSDSDVETKGSACLGSDCRTDSCSGGSAVKEWYCDNNQQKFKIINCPNGDACTGSEGVCKEVSVEPPVSGDDSVFNFAITFAGLSGEAKCWSDPSINLTMMGEDKTTKVYKGVPIEITDQKSGGLSVFISSIRLPGFNKRDKVAAFIKGPQHAQVKFARNGQDAFYNQAGGELTLTSGEDSPVYDFTKYPILAGDFTGEEEGVPDGKIDGRDFSFIKQRVSAINEVEEDTLGDINGDCVINSWDLGTFMKSFNEKMDQAY